MEINVLVLYYSNHILHLHEQCASIIMMNLIINGCRNVTRQTHDIIVQFIVLDIKDIVPYYMSLIFVRGVYLLISPGPILVLISTLMPTLMTQHEGQVFFQ